MEDYGIFEGLFTEIAAPLINGAINLATERVKTEWKKVSDVETAKQYKIKLKKQCDVIHILEQSEHRRLVKLYTKVYFDIPTKHPIHKLGKKKLIDGFSFAKQTNRLFIWGKPGSGKTTFAKNLVLQALYGKIASIPILVNLNEFSNSNLSLSKFIAKQFDVCNFPDAEDFIGKLLQKGKGFILFDGLDEVSQEKNKGSHIVKQLDTFIKKYDGNRYVITCRTAATNYKFIGFREVTIADFNPRQVEHFVHSWFSRQTQKRDSFLKALNKTDNKGIKEMASSPLLLSLLCIQFDSSMKFLTNRSDVYAKALDVLFKEWDSSREIERDDIVIENEDRYRALKIKQKKQLIYKLAYLSFVEGKASIKQDWLESRISQVLGQTPNLPDEIDIDGELILKGIQSQHGLLVEQTKRSYTFAHQTLQEYFAAKYIIDNPSKALKDLLSEKRITDPRWREVILFVAELLLDGDQFAIRMAKNLQEMAEKNGFRPLVVWAEKRTEKRALARRKMTSRIAYISRILGHTTDWARKISLSHCKNSNLWIESRNLAHKISNAHVSSQLLDVERYIRHGLEVNQSILSVARARYLDRIFHAFVDLSPNYIAWFDNDFDLDIASHLNFSKAINIAQYESQCLEWPQLTDALSQVPIIDFGSTQKETENSMNLLNEIEKTIILDNWQWNVTKIEFVENLIAWLNANALLFKCLDLLKLIDLERESFEDEMLYCLPKGEPVQLIDIDQSLSQSI